MRQGPQRLVADLSALVNDTVGTLCSAQYGDVAENTDTCISIIVGTGAPTPPGRLPADSSLKS